MLWLWCSPAAAALIHPYACGLGTSLCVWNIHMRVAIKGQERKRGREGGRERERERENERTNRMRKIPWEWDLHRGLNSILRAQLFSRMGERFLSAGRPVSRQLSAVEGLLIPGLPLSGESWPILGKPNKSSTLQSSLWEQWRLFLGCLLAQFSRYHPCPFLLP